jgi:uncharacterized protein DUF4232
MTLAIAVILPVRWCRQVDRRGIQSSSAGADPSRRRASDSLSHAAGVILTLTNSSRHTCALDGYPGLGLLNSRHQVLHTVIHWGSTFYANDPGRRLVDLAPGQPAKASLAWTQAGSSAVSASYLDVTPPDSTAHLTISFRQLVDGGDLGVTALARTVSFRI